MAAKRNVMRHWIGASILACAALTGTLHAEGEPAAPIPSVVPSVVPDARGLQMPIQSLQPRHATPRSTKAGAAAAIRPSRSTRAAQRFESRLIPRVAVELQSLSVLQGTELPGMEPQDQVLYREMSEAVLHGAERASRKAIKKVLVDAIDLDRRLDNVKMQIAGPRNASRGVRFDLGFHSAVPELSMRYEVGQGQMKLEIDAQGGVGLQYRRHSLDRTEVHIGYDGDDYFQLGYVIAF